jgi:hypothetical protein
LWNALLGGEVRVQVKHPDGTVDTVSDIVKATALTLPSSTDGGEDIEWLHANVKTLFLHPHIYQVFGEMERVWTTRRSGFAVMYVTDTHTLILTTLIVVLQELGRVYNLVITSSTKQPRPSGTYFSTK